MDDDKIVYTLKTGYEMMLDKNAQLKAVIQKAINYLEGERTPYDALVLLRRSLEKI